MDVNDVKFENYETEPPQDQMPRRPKAYNTNKDCSSTQIIGPLDQRLTQIKD